MEMSESSPNPINVLLIEDSREQAILVRSYLAPHGEISLDIVETLEGGEETLLKGGFDLILLDLFLPDSSGLATLKRIRESFPSIPVIVLTGLEGREGAEGAHLHGAAAFLTKGSLSSDQLLASIRFSMGSG
jgi:CheY-like chemotaxis protein